MPQSTFGTTVQGVADEGDDYVGFPAGIGGRSPTGKMRALACDESGQLFTVGGGGGGGGAVFGPNAIGVAPTQPPVFIAGTDEAGVIRAIRLATFADINATASPAATIQRVAADISIQDPTGNLSNRARAATSLVGGSGGGALIGAGIGSYDGANWQAARTANSAHGTVGAAVLGVGVLAQDGANFQRIACDTSGRIRVVGSTAISTFFAATPVTVSMIDGESGEVQMPSLALQNSDGINAVHYGLRSMSNGYKLGGASWDRDRNNIDVTLLASGARTTTQTSADITTFNLQGITAILDVTAIVTLPSITLSIQGKDPASGKYYNILVGAAVVGVSTNVYKNALGATVVVNVASSQPLPRIIRIVVTHGNADSITYSVGYTLHCGG